MSNLSSILGIVSRLVNGTTQVPVVYPDGANPTLLTGDVTGWTYGSYAEIVAASVLTGHNLIGMTIYMNQGDYFQIQIAQGTTVVGTFMAFSISVVGPGFYIPIDPPIQIPVNAQVQGRIRAENGSRTCRVALTFVPRPI